MRRFRTVIFAALSGLAIPAAAQRNDLVTGLGSYARRVEVQSFAQEMQQRHGIPAETLLAWFASATPQTDALRLIKPSTNPASRSWKRYRARYIEPVRLRNGLQFWDEHAPSLERARQEFGVPEEIIVAIIGVESIFGRHTGTFPTFDTLVTLAFDYPPRADLFRRELEALLLLARERGTSPLDYHGSFAGAIGYPQFLPSSIRSFAVDYDGNMQVDLERSPVDAIGSVARFLAEHGWRRGARIALHARLATGADIVPLLDAGISPQFGAAALAARGVSADQPYTPEEPAALIELDSSDAPYEYWLGYQNFYVITRYNRSSFYAAAVTELARALRLERQAHAAEQAAP